MTSGLSPSASLAALQPLIAARLRPLSAYQAFEAPVRSDFDLNPQGKVAGGVLAPAAVLVGLIDREEGPSVLLTRRSDALRRHSGQVAFPGGRMEAEETPSQAALRESFEEVGLDPAYVSILGLGDAYETGTGFSINPVVGVIRPGFSLTRHDAEVAEIFEAPFAFLMDPANHELRSLRGEDGAERRFYAMEHAGRTIWGATAGMIRALSERIFGAV